LIFLDFEPLNLMCEIVTIDKPRGKLNVYRMNKLIQEAFSVGRRISHLVNYYDQEDRQKPVVEIMNMVYHIRWNGLAWEFCYNKTISPGFEPE
jgi:hypothetical protein